MKAFDFLDSNARKIFCGQLGSQICDRMTSIGLIWVVTESYGAQWIPWYLAIGGLPHLLLSTFSAQRIQNLGALRVVVVSDYFRSLLYLAAFLLVLKHSIPMSVLFALVFITNIAAAFFNPALMSLPIRISRAEHLESLTALINSCSSLALVLGPLVAVLLFKFAGLSGIFLVTSIAYGLAGLASSGIRLSPEPAAAPAEDPGAASGSWQILRADTLILNILVVFFLMNLLFGPLQISLPAYAQQIYRAHLNGLAWLEGSLGAGMIAGSTFLTFFRVPGARLTRVTGGILISSVAYLGFSLTHSLWAGCLAIFLLGLSLGASNVWILNLFQERPPARSVPVIMSFVNLISVASIPFSMAVAGLVLPHTNIRILATVCAAGLLVLSAFTFFKYQKIGENP
jgi:DHA3 family macrolide efflux protein-like MFS transporter